MDATYTLPISEGLLRAKALWGKSPEKAPVYRDILWNLRGTDIVGGYLDYQKAAWQVRVSHIGMHFKHEMPFDQVLAAFGMPALPAPYVALVPEMVFADKWAWYDSLALVYDASPFQAHFMINQIDHESPAYEDSWAGYLLLAYRIGALSPYVGFSRVVSSPDSVPPSLIDPMLDPILDVITRANQAQTHNDQNTYTLGARWDFHKSMALKAQVDWLKGDPSSIYLFRTKGVKAWDGDMTVFSLTLDFVF